MAIPADRAHIVALLGALRDYLSATGRQADAGRASLIHDAVAQAPDLDRALEGLYAVRGFGDFALRLMWYADRSRDPLAGELTSEFVSRAVNVLLGLLPPVHGPEGARPTPPPEAPPEVSAAIESLGDLVKSIGRQTLDEQGFRGIPPRFLERLRKQAITLGRSAELENNEDVHQFSKAMERFIDLVITRDLAGDVRVLNMLDSAALTLQTASSTLAGEDIDSLQQTTQLLEDPLPLLEPFTRSNES